jgi:hypothetical protein
MRSDAFLPPWLEVTPPSLRQGERQSGRVRVWYLDPKEQQHGGSLMPNISEWPNDAVVCSLSQVLETGDIPQRFYLSPKACAGILRRAEKRGKALPEALEVALRSIASAPEQV